MARSKKIERCRLLTKSFVDRAVELNLVPQPRRAPFIWFCRTARQPTVAADSCNRCQHTGAFGARQRRHCFAVVRTESLNRQQHAPAAALAEIGPECPVEPRRHRSVTAREQRLRLRERAPFERAAADRSGERAAWRDYHAGARFARA